MQLIGFASSLLLAATACGGDGTHSPAMGDASTAGSGFLVYSEAGTDRVMRLDVQTGEKTVIDPGQFGSLAIAPDGKYVAYVGADKIPKVADFAGNVTPLATAPAGCSGTPVWGPGDSISYCVDGSSGSGTVLVPSIGGSTMLFGDQFAVTADASHVVFVDRQQPGGPSQLGDLIEETVTGTDRRVLRSGMADFIIALTPDGAGVLIDEAQAAPPYRALRIALADGSVQQDLGVFSIAGALPGSSPFSPDGKQLLVWTNSALAALDIATGTTRTLATFDTPLRALAGAWIDTTRILFYRQDDLTPPGSDVGMTTESIWVSDGTPSQLFAATGMNTQCDLRSVSLSQQLAAARCPDPTLVDFTGRTIVTHPGFDTVGITRDGRLISIAYDGTVTMSGADTTRTLVVAETPFQHTTPNDLLDPYAVFAP